MIMPGVFTYDRVVPIPHMHVPISAYITSRARATLYDYLAQSSEVHYCDTDGFSTVDTYPESDGLGGLKLEKLIRHGQFVQAKVYRLDGTTVEGEELGNDGVKAKGFSRMTIERFEKLTNGQEIEYVRMGRIKESLRAGVFRPREQTIRKRLRREIVSKRCFDREGKSRPWSVSELDRELDPDW